MLSIVRHRGQSMVASDDSRWPNAETYFSPSASVTVRWHSGHLRLPRLRSAWVPSRSAKPTRFFRPTQHHPIRHPLSQKTRAGQRLRLRGVAWVPAALSENSARRPPSACKVVPEMDSDDSQIGRILSRREVLALLGGSSAAFLAACAPGGALASPSPARSTQPTSSAATAATSPATAVLPSCIVRPALTDGPFFVDEKLDRSDIRSDPGTGAVRPGAPLALTFLVS